MPSSGMSAFKSFVVTWLPLIMLVMNWLIVRYSKPDTKMPWNLSPRLRPWFPIGLSIVVGTLERFVGGTDLSAALRTAIIGGLGPILAHELGTESLMNGKELWVPFMKKRAPIVSLAGAIGSGGLLGIVVMGVMLFLGCAGYAPSPKTPVDSGKLAICVFGCVDDQESLTPRPPPLAVVKFCVKQCSVEEEQVVIDLMTARSRSIARARAHSISGPGPCPASSAPVSAPIPISPAPAGGK